MSTEVVRANGNGAVMASSSFMPVMDIEMAKARRKAMSDFIGGILEKDEDFGTIPGTKKPCLMKPGAEKLCSFFGLEPDLEVCEEQADFTGATHGGEVFYYIRYRCMLYRDGRRIGVGEGSGSTWESKYRYRWVTEDQVPAGIDRDRLQSQDGTRTHTEYEFAIDKAETTGKWGKPAEYWKAFRDAIDNGTAKVGMKEMRGKQAKTYSITIGARLFRIPNPDVMDQINTIQKMAQKRAFVAAILMGTGASQFFTQDLDDLPQGAVVDEKSDEKGDEKSDPPPPATKAPAPAQTKAPPAPPAQAPPAEPKAKARAPFDPEKYAEQMRLSYGLMREAIGDDAYFRILGGRGFENSDQILQSPGTPDELVALARRIYLEMAAEKKRQDEEKAEDDPFPPQMQ